MHTSNIISLRRSTTLSNQQSNRMESHTYPQSSTSHPNLSSCQNQLLSYAQLNIISLRLSTTISNQQSNHIKSNLYPQSSSSHPTISSCQTQLQYTTQTSYHCVFRLRYQIKNPIAWSHTSIHNRPHPIPTSRAAKHSCNTQLILKHHIIASFDHDIKSAIQ